MLRPLACTLLLATACQSESAPKGQLYFDRVIQPILQQSCARGASGCHSADPADPFAFSAGNLDVTTFENIKKRPDVLRSTGLYPVPFLLAKAVAETNDLKIVYLGKQYPLLVPHAGGAVVAVGSPAFLTLQTWLENGATRDGVKPTPAPAMGSTPCSGGVPAGFDAAQVTATTQWQSYAGDFDAVQKILSDSGCNAGNCHGAPQSDFYITCGGDDTQKAWNFHQVWSFVADPVDFSEVLQRTTRGGVPHTGGTHFSGTDDPKYQTIAAFAGHVGPIAPDKSTPGRAFFVDNVLPRLLSRGCGAEGCHSPAAMNDFKMRSGTQSFFSAVSIDKDYRLIRDEFMAMEMPDARRGRLVAKNVFPTHGGIAHRGGPLLEAGNNAGDPTTCPNPYDAAASSAFCTLVEWQRIERMAIGAPNALPVPAVWVERDAPSVGLLEFDTYLPGSDLIAGSFDGTSITRTKSLLAGCGVDAGSADVRAPDVRNDGTTVAFALRRSAGETLQLWTVQIDGSNCKPLLAEAGVHDFDPAWSVDGEWVVYASTKRGGTSRRFGRPQSDLWRVRRDGGGAEEMTFLSNSEIGPQMMREGRVSMTTEKVDQRDPQGGFYQLSGRRINWDLTDYHPLLGQRQKSAVDPTGMDPDVKDSIGFPQATEIREGLDGNFLLILSNLDTHMVGSLAVFNRSVGPFESGRKDSGYLASVTTIAGAFRSPFPLPDGRILASQDYAGVFRLVAVDPATGTATMLSQASRSQLEAVLAYAYPPRGFYDNRRQLVFGGAADASDPGHATVHFVDAPMLATLLGANLRRGRHPDGFRAADSVTLLGADGAALGSAKLAADGSARLRAPASTPVYIALTKGGTPIFQMSEEHQFGPGENISLGVREELFDYVCAGCHGSVSGKELDVGVTPDTLTGASTSISATAAPTQVGP